MASDTKPSVTIPDGPPPGDLVIEDLEIGNGAEAVVGQPVDVHYVGVVVQRGGVRLVLEPQRAVRLPSRGGTRHPRMGPGRGRHESRRTPSADHPAPPRLRVAGCRGSGRPTRPWSSWWTSTTWAEPGPAEHQRRPPARPEPGRGGAHRSARNRSSSGGRTISSATEPGRRASAGPRRAPPAAGIPRSFPITRSAAPASSSAHADLGRLQEAPVGIERSPREVHDPGDRRRRRWPHQ